MKTENRKIESLKPYAKNAKKHSQNQIDNVAQSIQNYGFVQPIVIDKNGVIVIGHCRYEAAKKLNMLEVPCVCVSDLTEMYPKAKSLFNKKGHDLFYGMLYKYGVRKVCEYRSDSNFEKTYGFFTF